MSKQAPKQLPKESAWAYVQRVYGYAGTAARLMLSDRMELDQLNKLKRRPHGAIAELERLIKHNADILIQGGI